MARPGVIEKYNLEREANRLLVPKDKDVALNYLDIAIELTRLARQKAVRENPDLVQSGLLEDVTVSEQAVRRYVKANPRAKEKVLADDKQKATEAVSNVMAGAALLMEQIKDIRAYLASWKKKKGADVDADKLCEVDLRVMDRMHGRLESLVATLFQIQTAAFKPDVMARFFETLDAELIALFGDQAPTQLKLRLVTKPEFLALADVLGWDKPEELPETASPPLPPERMVM